MRPDLRTLAMMARRVVLDCLGYDNYDETDRRLGIMSFGFLPGGLLQAVFEGEIDGHLIQVELVETDQYCPGDIIGKVLKPARYDGPTLRFGRPRGMWIYQRMYR